jgi:predicted glycosyltransferase
MKILIDIGHPAHVHYFKNFIWVMQEKGHTVHIVARDKEVAFKLLDFYKFPYFNRGKGRNGFIGKILYLFKGDFFILKKALKLRPDVFLSTGSSYAAQVAWLMRKPHIALDDTDHNLFQHMMYVPFTKAILTPKVFQKDFGAKHVRFNGFLELGSLHPKRFKQEPEGLQKKLADTDPERFVILRFVSWQATHDIGLKGLSLKDKYALVQSLSKYAKVIISSEEKLPDDLMSYSFKVHPALMHTVLSEASLLVSESLTMAAESAFVGTPVLCISTAQAGTLDEEVKLGLIELYRNSDGLIERAIELIKDTRSKEKFAARSKEIINNKTDVTAFLVWFVENYPNSLENIKKNPELESNFK